MRLIGLTLCLSLLSLAFAPAPVPKRDRETPELKRQREMATLTRRLDELGVKWQVAADGQDGRVVRYAVEVNTPARSGGMHGAVAVSGGDLAHALRQVVRQSESFLREVTTSY